MGGRSISRSRLAVTFTLATAIVAALLARSSDMAAVEAMEVLEPEFLSWSGEPFNDGLNHFVAVIDVSASTDGESWLTYQDGATLVAEGAPPDDAPALAIDEIQAAVTGENRQPTSPIRALEMLEGINELHPIGFGIYSISGQITLEEVSSAPGVVSVAEDSSLTAATIDPYYPSQWGLDNDGAGTDPWVAAADADIDAPQGWHRTRGEGVIVAVVDSGADVSHPDLAANVWVNAGEQCGNGIDDDGNGYIDDCNGWDFANRVSSVIDHVGHGTHVAGIIAAEADNEMGIAGVAHESELMVLKIGDGTPALSAAIEAIGYAIDNGARVINASWGVNDPAAEAFLDGAIAAAAEAGVLVVTAAGNEPINIDGSSWFPAASTLDNVVTVGASTPTDNPASWSGYGPTSVDIFAPGEYIISTVPGGYGIYSGTSMAAPMVSGAAALLWAATPQASYAEIKGALLDRSDGPNDGVTAFRTLAVSEGRLNIERAVYSAPLFQPGVMYEFHDFNSFEPGITHPVSITAKTVDPWDVPPQTPSMYRAGLYVPKDGNPMAVVGLEITYAGSAAATTDGSGRALLGTEFHPENRSSLVQSGDVTPLEMQLPAGTYAFVMEIVDVTNPGSPVTMGDPAAVFFIVDTDGSIREMPQIPIGGNPAPTTSTTVAQTTAASTTSAPTTTITVPATSTTSTTVTGAPTTTTTTTNPAGPTTTVPPSTTTTTTLSVGTTSAPSPTTTTAPPVETTTTTSPPGPTTTIPSTTTVTTSGPGATTTSTTTTSVAPAGIRITSVNPSQGPPAGRTLVTIAGENLPLSPDVYFGDQRAEIVTVIAPTFIVTDTPSGAPGWVDVRIVDRNTGEEAVLANGFLYVEEGTVPSTTTTTTTAGPLTSTTTLPATTTSLVSTTIAATTQPSPSTTAAPALPPERFDQWRDSLLRTPEGLTLAPPAAADPINNVPLDVWVGALCDEPICRGWILEG